MGEEQNEYSEEENFAYIHIHVYINLCILVGYIYVFVHSFLYIKDWKMKLRKYLSMHNKKRSKNRRNLIMRATHEVQHLKNESYRRKNGQKRQGDQIIKAIIHFPIIE